MDLLVARVDGDLLRFVVSRDRGGGRYVRELWSLPVDPGRVARELCAPADREFTDEETGALPAGVVPGRPCAR